MGLGFAIKYKDTLLDLVKDTALTVEWYSTIFNEAEIFRGSYSYPVELKLSSKNKALLGMPNLLENRLSRQKIEVSIILFGHTWKKAIYDYEVHADRISGNLLIDNAIIADWLRESTLPDMWSYYDGDATALQGINIGDNVSERNTYLNNTATALPGTYPMAFPGMYNYGWDGTYKRWGGNSECNVYYSDSTPGFKVYDLAYFFCPMFYLTWVIGHVCDKMGFKAVGSFMDHPEVKRWIIFNNTYITGSEMHQAGFRIYPSRHLPKITIGTLFKILRNDFRLSIYFDSLTRQAHFNVPSELLDGDHYIDLGNLVVRDSLSIKNSTPKKYRIKMVHDDNDQVVQYYDTIESLLMGEADTDTTVELSVDAPRMHRPITQEGINFYRWPMIDQLVNLYDPQFADMEAYNKDGEIGKNAFGFRLLSYRGLQPYDSNDNDLLTSYATTDNCNALGLIDNDIIATDPTNESSWLRKVCEPFYRMLHMSEQIDVDMYVGVEKFKQLSPLSKGRIRTRSGAQVSILFDRITFEPKGKKSMLFAKVKAYTQQNASALLGGMDAFRIGEVTKKEEMVYLGAWFVDVRADGTDRYAKVLFQFYEDRYCQLPQSVTGLEINFEILRHITTSSGTGLMVFERKVTVGVGVYSHKTTEEFAITSTLSGGLFESEIVVHDGPMYRHIL